MQEKNVYRRSNTSRNISVIKKVGLILLAAAVLVYLYLSVRFLIS